MFRAILRRSTLAKCAALATTLALTAMVAACGASSAPTVGGGPAATILCSQAAVGHGIDVVNMKLTCKVTGAASNATSFQIHYAIKTQSGAQRGFDAPCNGALQNGAGTCAQTYALVVPMDMGTATISGEFLPTHQAIAPMTLAASNG